MFHSQKHHGFISFSGFIIVIFGGFFLWAAVHIIPLYWDRYSLIQALELSKKEAYFNSKQEAYSAISRKLEARGINLTPDDIELSSKNGQQTIKIYFHKEIKINKFITLSADEWIIQQQNKSKHED
jgi:hypothetical protein